MICRKYSANARHAFEGNRLGAAEHGNTKKRNVMVEKENVLIEDVLGAGETVDAKHKTTIHK